MTTPASVVDLVNRNRWLTLMERDRQADLERRASESLEELRKRVTDLTQQVEDYDAWLTENAPPGHDVGEEGGAAGAAGAGVSRLASPDGAESRTTRDKPNGTPSSPTAPESISGAGQ